MLFHEALSVQVASSQSTRFADTKQQLKSTISKLNRKLYKRRSPICIIQSCLGKPTAILTGVGMPPAMMRRHMTCPDTDRDDVLALEFLRIQLVCSCSTLVVTKNKTKNLVRARLRRLCFQNQFLNSELVFTICEASKFTRLGKTEAWRFASRPIQSAIGTIILSHGNLGMSRPRPASWSLPSTSDVGYWLKIFPPRMPPPRIMPM